MIQFYVIFGEKDQVNSRESDEFNFEPSRVKTNNLGFRPGLTQTRLHRRWLEALNFLFMKKNKCTIHVAKTKMLISCAVTAQLICIFVFAYAGCWFPGVTAPLQSLFALSEIF